MCDKRKKNKKEKKTKKLSQLLKSHISGTLEAISLKFGMWSAHVHSKNRLVSSRQHRATEVRKLCFLSSCQYTDGCCAPASWAARHTTVCLDLGDDWTHLCIYSCSLKVLCYPYLHQSVSTCDTTKPIILLFFSATTVENSTAQL